MKVFNCCALMFALAACACRPSAVALAEPAPMCSSNPVTLPRAMSDRTLSGCKVTTFGYFTPDEYPALFLAPVDHATLGAYGGLPLVLDMNADDRGRYLRLADGEIRENSALELVLVTGRITWEGDEPTMIVASIERMKSSSP